MRIAVLTLTRDRLAYTKHCYQTLLEHAGCDFDHFIVDQASEDGTPEWLSTIDATVIPLKQNIGICRALNLLIKDVFDPFDYDVLVRWDNDCELLEPDTLKITAELCESRWWILAPQVDGLRNPPAMGHEYVMDGFHVRETAVLGGIFMGIPAHLFDGMGYVYDESQPLWAGDELICPWYRAREGHCGYITDLRVNHYLTTDGQAEDIPDYFERRVLEGGPAR